MAGSPPRRGEPEARGPPRPGDWLGGPRSVCSVQVARESPETTHVSVKLIASVGGNIGPRNTSSHLRSWQILPSITERKQR